MVLQTLRTVNMKIGRMLVMTSDVVNDHGDLLLLTDRNESLGFVFILGLHTCFDAIPLSMLLF